MLASVFTTNLLVLGVVRGLIVALVAMGIVLVFRSSRVINFAVGNIGVPAAALLAVMVGVHDWPYWPSLAFALLIGTLSGTVVELAVIRRLFNAPRVIVLVATIGVAQLAEAITRAIPEVRTGRLPTRYPTPISSEWHPGGGITITGSQLLVLIVVPLVTLGLWWLLGHTRFGDAVRASATNADLARMTGINPKLVSTAVWTIAGFLSALAVILLATDQRGTDLVAIGPDTLLRGLVAALIGRMTSFPMAVFGAVAVGVAEQVITFNYTSETGLISFVLFLVVLALVARMSRGTDEGGESFQFAPRVDPVPERLKQIWWVRHMPRLVGAVAVVAAIALPIAFNEPGRQLIYSTILAFALCAMSVTVLTGWGGQLSLGQMAFAGISALTAAALIRGVSVDIGWHSTRILQGSLSPQPFWLALLVGSLVAAFVATLVGLGALRVRGLLLAISTLAFAIATQAYVFRRPFFSLGRQTVRLPREELGPIDVTHKQRAYYYVTLAVLVVVFLVVSHLRRSGIGRSIIGVRENEPAAAAMSVSPTRTKLIAFALAGWIAGIGGSLLGGLVETLGYAERFVRVTDSLMVVSIAVIGGLGSLAGAVVGALWIVGLPAFWPDNKLVPLLTSSIGLLIILLYIPGGFLQIAYYARSSLFRWLEARMPEAPAKTTTVPPSSLARTGVAPASLNPDGSVLATHGLTVHFGGIAAVEKVDFFAKPGEVVGLIGTNGAGKSTLLNAIGGFVRSSGRTELLGKDVSRFDAHRRSRLGLGRTFQAATLFPELTVRETVQLALEARHRTSFWGTALWLPPATRTERRKRADSDELIDFLGLGRYADRFVAELSTGTRRIVELACVLAVAPRVICLDEPTAGVAQREAEAFGPLIKRVQQELDATLIVVEHDLPLIMAISDRVYCLEAGKVIACDEPAAIRADARVIASYLGTDDRAIQRSNA
jgi:ABC-type branched-subunit amino acid transport system ATPase component/ABC-type branched-subunit amino acid transport system permease subunit